jgi:hypothetical protein
MKRCSDVCAFDIFKALDLCLFAQTVDAKTGTEEGAGPSVLGIAKT